MATSKKYDVTHTAFNIGYKNHKEVKFKYLTGLKIQKFRSLKDRYLPLGKCITVITGKNGTMKSSLLGLIAHPFSSPNNAKDLYNQDLKTDMRNVFRLSLEKDSEEYIYYLEALTTNDEILSEPIRVYPRPEENRHRVTVGGTNEAGSGNFALNTSMITLSRLYPMINTESHVIEANLSEYEKRTISREYELIMQRSAFNQFETVSDQKIKNTCGPKNTYYDFNSISSGEDNLGSILYKLLAFERAKTNENCLQGILCIDEFEASLHPVVQTQFFDFLLKWSKKNHVQIVMTTHSLYLMYHCLSLQQHPHYEDNAISIVNISTMQVGRDNNFRFISNPDYKTIYKELTYVSPDEAPPYKVNVICEDNEAKNVLTKLLGRTVTKHINIITNISGNEGSSWSGLVSLAKNGSALLEDSVILLDADAGAYNVPFQRITKLFDADSLPIEKRIVKYVNSLGGDEPLFHDQEISAFRSKLGQYGIDPTTVKTQKTKIYKDWKDQNKRFFQRALHYYLKDNEEAFRDCRNTILSMINELRIKKGLESLK